MQFEIGVRLEPARLRLAGIADATQLLAEGRAVDAAKGISVAERQPADVDQAAHGVRRKARALLVGEGDKRQRPARGNARIVERLAGFESGEHAIEAVVAATGADS